MAKQGGADVDGQAAIDQFGGEDALEVARAELGPGELGTLVGKL